MTEKNILKPNRMVHFTGDLPSQHGAFHGRWTESENGAFHGRSAESQNGAFHGRWVESEHGALYRMAPFHGKIGKSQDEAVSREDRQITAWGHTGWGVISQAQDGASFHSMW